MFDLHEDKLGDALDVEENDLDAFDPMKVDADALHDFIGEAESQGVVGREDAAVCIAIHPLALGEPEPLVAVRTSRSIVVGGSVLFETGPDEVEGTIGTMRRIVEAADAIYAGEARDHHELDRLASMLNEYADEGREWDHAEICNKLVKALRETGRPIRLTDD